MQETIKIQSSDSIAGVPKTYNYQERHIEWLQAQKRKLRKPISYILQEILDKEMAQEAQPANS